jgi:hypothetical protein
MLLVTRDHVVVHEVAGFRKAVRPVLALPRAQIRDVAWKPLAHRLRSTVLLVTTADGTAEIILRGRAKMPPGGVEEVLSTAFATG